jgi:hypothetical protein
MKRLDKRRKMVFTTLVTGKLSENGPKNSSTKLFLLSSWIANVHWVLGLNFNPECGRWLVVLACFYRQKGFFQENRK